MNAPPFNNVTRSNLLREKLRSNLASRIVLYSGGITFNRGLEELITSLNYLKNIVLVIMGYGAPRYVSELKKFIRSQKLSDRVFFFGPVPHGEVTKYAASADLGAAPIKNSCLSYYYCSPNKVFEYVGAGLPVVGSNFPELKKVIEGYGLGKTFDPDDPVDIARAISYVLSDQNKYKIMAKNAYEAIKIFNWENEEKKLLKIYQDLS